MANLKSFLLFLSLSLLVYCGANYYLYRRAMQGAATSGATAWALKLLIIGLVLAYPLGRALGAVSPGGRTLIWIGSFWLGALTYGILIALLIDLLRLSDLLTGWFPNWVSGNRLLAGRMLFASATVLILMLLAGGHIRALYPKVREQAIALNRFPPGRAGYRIAVFADTHAGPVVGRRWFSRIVEQVNGLSADMILIPGDLFDEPPRSVPWVGGELAKLTAPDGVWAVTGNHEFYSGAEACAAVMASAGVRVLRDTTVVIPGLMNLIGVDDITGGRQFRVPLKPIKELVAAGDPNLPVIAMHHTPQRLAEAEAAGVDLLLSGHTHDGQLWPLGYLTELVYGVDEGYSRIGRMQFYLTNGAGTWGPPARVGNAPEIVLLVLKGKG